MLSRLVLEADRVVPPASFRLSIIHHLLSSIQRTRYFWLSRLSVRILIVPTLLALQTSEKFCILPVAAAGAVIDSVLLPVVLIVGELQTALVPFEPIDNCVQLVPPIDILLPYTISVPKIWVYVCPPRKLLLG